MVGQCKQGGCEKVDGHQKTLYGDDGTGGIVKCINKKVGWKQLGLAVLGLIGVITTITLYAMAAEKKQNDKIAEIPVIQKDIEHIKSSVKEIKETVKEMQKQTITKDDINRLIDAVKKGK